MVKEETNRLIMISVIIISHWRTELKRKKEGKRPRLLVTILKCFWQRILLHGVLFFTEVSCQLTHQNLFLNCSNPIAKLWYHALMIITTQKFQISSQVAQSVLLGNLAGYFTIEEPTAEDTRNAYLYALG